MQPRSSGNLRPAQAAALVADVAFRRREQRFWPLGSHVGAHLLAEVATKHPGSLTTIERFLDRACQHEDTIRRLGITDWPALPLRAVPR